MCWAKRIRNRLDRLGVSRSSERVSDNGWIEVGVLVNTFSVWFQVLFDNGSRTQSCVHNTITHNILNPYNVAMHHDGNTIQLDCDAFVTLE